MSYFWAQILTSLLIFSTMEYSKGKKIVLHPSCTGNETQCLTLAGLTVPSSQNITLVLLPGVHQVSSTLVFRWNYWTIKGMGSDNATILACSPVDRDDYNIRFWRNFHTELSDLFFSHCKVHFDETNNTIIRRSVVLSSSNGPFYFTGCRNVTIFQSDFKDKPSSGWSVIYFTNTWGIKVIRSRFLNNSIAGNSQAVIAVHSSYGKIKCNNFFNNTVYSRYAGIIKVDHGSRLYISNSTFSRNTIGQRYDKAVINIFDTCHVIVESCTFKNNNALYTSIIRTHNEWSMLTLLSTKFISNVGLLINPHFNRVIAECSDISVRRESTTIIHSHGELCKNTSGASATCNSSASDLKEYVQPLAGISLEKSEYIVSEQIGREYRALQICAVATDLLYPMQTGLIFQNGSATENQDYTVVIPRGQTFYFTRKSGIQKQCVLVMIIEDSIQEGNEHFFVRLESVEPFTYHGIVSAKIVIKEDFFSTKNVPTEAAVTTIPSPIDRTSKTLLVECGPLRRLVTYPSRGNDTENLKNAIVQAFRGPTGLLLGHIAVLQVKSELWDEYIDVTDASAVPDGSKVKVVTYGFTCNPKAF